MTTEIADKTINRFKDLVSRWTSAYKWAEVSYFALKTDTDLQILFCRVLFDTIVTAKSLQFESENISAGREWFATDSYGIIAWCEEAKRGEVTFKDKVLKLVKSENATFSYWFSPFYHPALQYGVRLPTASVRGIQTSQLFSSFEGSASLDWEVRSADTPYNDVNELLFNLGLPSLFQAGDSTIIELIGRSPAMISDASRIENGTAFVELRTAPNIAIEKVKLGYSILHKDKTVRSFLMGKTIAWSSSGEVQLGKAEIKVEEAPILQAFVSYDGAALHQWWISDPTKHLNPRFAIHETVDKKLELITDFLLNPKKDSNGSRNFESAISVLLSLLGFAVTHYGEIKTLQDGPDIIAITPRGNVGIVECTIGLLDEKDKLAKLVRRTKLIKESLAAAGHGYIVIQPVIVSALPREQVTANLEEAHKHRITVVCREDIERLLNQVNLPASPDRFFDEAVQSVSGAEQIANEEPEKEKDIK
jgi:hypothetical protein